MWKMHLFFHYSTTRTLELLITFFNEKNTFIRILIFKCGVDGQSHLTEASSASSQFI